MRITTMGIKQETDMLKRSNGDNAVTVTDIVKGLESCKISNNASKDSGLNELLKNLTIDEPKVTEKPRERKAQPSEDDERGVIGLVCDLVTTPDNLVKLEAPNVDDKEEDEDDTHSLNGEGGLEERGPMHGVPANYHVQMGHIANKPCMPYQVQNVFTGDNSYSTVPANFPDYGYQHMKSNQEKGNKRGMEERETYSEYPKFIKPVMEVTNNLSPPCYPANSAVGNANGKTVTHVYQNQLSGGTIYTPDDNQPQSDDSLNGGPDSQELQDLFGFGSDIRSFNIPVHTEDILQACEPPSPNVIDIIEQSFEDERNQMISQIGMGFHQQPWNKPPPHVSQPAEAYNVPYYQSHNFDDYQHTSQHYQAGGHQKRGSFGNDDGSDGYASDLSPSHEPQMSPTPSPRSVMDSSPAAMNGSPPRTNWSPPPSNMSCSSADSGVGSPFTDELSGYSSQKSPRQRHMMSPHSASSMPGTLHQSRSSPLTTPSASLPASKEYQVTSGETESQWINSHLTDLDIALEIASQDLMSEKLKKGYPLTPLQITSMTSLNNNYSAVNNMPNRYSENLFMATQSGLMGSQSQAGYMVTNTGINGVTNSGMNGKIQQNIPSLPTTVPATIQLGNNNMNGQYTTNRISQSDHSKNRNDCQPGSTGIMQPIMGTVGQQWEPQMGSGNCQINFKGVSLSNTVTRNTVQVTQPAGLGQLIRTPANISSRHPPVNSQGKIPIEPINQKPKLPGQSSVLLMTPNSYTAVFIVPQNIPAKTPQRALRTLKPKDPAKQNEKTVDINTKPSSGGNSPTSCIGNSNQGDKPTVAPAPTGKKTGGSSVEKLLNLARRLVAEMSTADLKYRDEDGDTYLHVAVCKADKFMVQALLERLVREDLTEMIDKQNLQGQTPLYLAVSTNNAEMVQLLIEQGADVNPFAESETSTGAIEKTAAIHCASTKGEKHLNTLLALLKAPAVNINQVNSDGHTALNCAILAHGRRNADQTLVNSIPIIRALLQAHADPNLQVQQSGKTALMYALESRDLDLIESTFQLVEPQKLSVFLKTQAFDSSSCVRIAESLKATLDPAGQQRLFNCLKSGGTRGVW